MLLTGIGDEIYSTVDACYTAHEMWIGIERLQQGESLNVQDVKTNLFWEFGKFPSRDGELMEFYYTRFYKMMNEMIARNAIELVTAAQQYPDSYYQAPKPQRSFAPTLKHSSSTRSHTTTRFKGKEIAKPITPSSESASKEDSDPEQAQRDKDMQKDLALIAKYVKDNQIGQFGNQRIVTVDGTREPVDSQLEDTYKEVDEQELEAHYSFMVKIQEVLLADLVTDAEPLEKADQNAEECDDERDTLANLIVNLTLDTEENKKILKQLMKANASLSQELKECKSTLEETTRALWESNSTVKPT
nr:hypothetical protein [Tanacetum cinerariifolium]